MRSRCPSFKSSACLAALAAVAVCQAEINYHVTVNPDNKQIAVEITVPAPAGPVSVQIPNWMPGAYSYGNFYENVHDVAATDSKGATLAVTHPDNNTWTTQATGDGAVKFTYWVPIGGQRRFAQGQDAGFVQISGPATYMYVVGRKPEGCQVKFDVPSSWPIAVGLDSKGGPNSFTAPSYDVLADNPVSTGSDILIDQYKLRGKDHYIVLEGAAKSQVDRPHLIKCCRFVSAAETDFFGGAPYHKYVWHFIVNPAADGAGGLEHLSSTQISLAAGVGPRAQSVLSHEFFHLWNVKRTRAKVLGPFDYLMLPRTGNLWWLEGVTDYYATLLPYRYGEWERPEFYDGLIRNMNAIRNNPARLEVSPYQASYKVADAAGGRGNSNGFNISYYNLGWLCGMCLDTEIRAQTNGKHSLDDVTRALYQMCKDNKPGFEEDEIRKQCIKFGGPSLGDFYDKVVMNPGELPIEAQLAKMGCKIEEKDQSYTDIGFGLGFGRGGGGGAGARGPRVGNVHGPATGQLEAGDVIVAINGETLPNDNPARAAAAIRDLETKATVGTPISLDITRDGQAKKVEVTPVSATRKVRSIVEDPSTSPAAIALREGWLMRKTPSEQ